MTYDENVFKEKLIGKPARSGSFCCFTECQLWLRCVRGIISHHFLPYFPGIVLAASDLRRSAVTCKGLGNGALPLRSGHRLRHLLYLCNLYHSVTHRIHLHPSGDKLTGPV